MRTFAGEEICPWELDGSQLIKKNNKCVFMKIRKKSEGLDSFLKYKILGCLIQNPSTTPLSDLLKWEDNAKLL